MKKKTVILMIVFLIPFGSDFSFGQDSNPMLQGKFNQTILGENVFVFDPRMDMKEIQVMIDTIFARQNARRSEFTGNRYALLFKPGKYSLDVKLGYYMQILGLGRSPEDVVITGAVRSNSRGNSVLVNFWRGVENITVVPTSDSTMTWGVSQAAPMRRVHIKGNINLFDKGSASGGFLADSRIDGIINSGPQQQWLSRNCEWKKWVGGNWNMMFIGVKGAPAEVWPDKPYTAFNETPAVREKPYLTIDDKGFNVKVPKLKMNSSGPGWLNDVFDETTLRLNKFYIVKQGADDSESINSALKRVRICSLRRGYILLTSPSK